MKKIAQTVIVADCYYTIANTSGKVMEGAESETNGAAVQLGVYSHKPSQEWSFIRVGEGVYRIKNRGTGKMLDLMMGGSADGTWLHQWADANCSSQMWIVDPTNDGRVKLRSQLASGRCIDVVNMSTEAGARLQIWQDVNGENQLWKIAQATEKKARGRKPAEAPDLAAQTAAAPVAEKAAAEKTSAVKAPVAEKAPAAEKKPRGRKPAAAKATAAKPAAEKTSAVKAAVAEKAPAAEKKPRGRKAAK